MSRPLHTEPSSQSSHFNDITKGANPFQVPDGYFDKLPHIITDRLHAKRQDSEVFKLKPAISYFSLLTLAIAAFLCLSLPMNNTSANVSSFSLNEADVRYILNHTELFGLDDFSVTEEYISLIDPSTDAFSLPEEQIKEYLEENTSIHSIINEL